MKLLFILFINLAAISLGFAATSSVAVDRYSSITEAATPAQLNPLLTVVSIDYSPATVSNIREAVNQVLVYSGYSLVPDSALPCAVRTVLSKPVPLVDREFQAMSIQDVILTLVGKNHFRLKQDSITRTINFQVIGTMTKADQVCK